MPCIAPPEYSDVELLAFIDSSHDHHRTTPDNPGVRDGGSIGRARLADHLAHCPHCRGRAERLQSEEGRARRLLSRAACPTSDELGEYELELLEPVRASEIAGHVDRCPRCRTELATLGEFLTALTPDVSLSPVERLRNAVDSGVRVLVARLLGGDTPAPAYALRGEVARPSVYAAEDLQVVVEAQPAAGQPELYTVLGITTGLIEATDYSAHLWRDDIPINSSPLDPLGNFVFEHLEKGRYDVLITGPALQVHVPAVDVGGSRPPGNATP